ncbi:MAG: RNA polymerase factor sigma-54 [Flavobacteriaceae bacterium]|nr:RNA polymerase factor sigma-54 [Flavobacteriaceae bacterium]MBL6870895.1 RNA polymerase factor sigma-54 [Flavobacteriaceae bacterium]
MLKQQLQIKLSQKLSPQQIQLMKMIQLSTLELEQKIESEMGENPALESGMEKQSSENQESNFEEGEKIEADEIDIDQYLSDDEIPSYKLYSNNYSSDDQERTIPVSGGISFHQHLSQQVGNLILSEDEFQIAEFIIGSIDESGYLRRSTEELIDDLAFTQNIIVTEEQIEKILKSVQTLDPPGVGARSLKECLQLQLEKKKKDRPEVELALEIIKNHFDHFSHKHYTQLQERIGISKEELKTALDLISKLNPKPGGALSSINQNTHIVPDFILTIEDGELHVALNQRNAPQLRVSNAYKDMLSGYSVAPSKSKSQQEAVQFIKQKLDAAKWFIDAIKQRHQTLSLTINAILDHQREFFLTGDERKLRPMILKDIAEKVNMDISTISRVANSKYIDTPYGVKLLKTFFSEGLKNDEGEDVSTIEIKKILEQFIAEESKKKPLTDQTLSEMMKEKGYIVARRTIAKYREQLDIPVARMRREL